MRLRLTAAAYLRTVQALPERDQDLTAVLLPGIPHIAAVDTITTWPQNVCMYTLGGREHQLSYAGSDAGVFVM